MSVNVNINQMNLFCVAVILCIIIDIDAVSQMPTTESPRKLLQLQQSQTASNNATVAITSTTTTTTTATSADIRYEKCPIVLLVFSTAGVIAAIVTIFTGCLVYMYYLYKLEKSKIHEKDSEIRRLKKKLKEQETVRIYAKSVASDSKEDTFDVRRPKFKTIWSKNAMKERSTSRRDEDSYKTSYAAEVQNIASLPEMKALESGLGPLPKTDGVQWSLTKQKPSKDGIEAIVLKLSDQDLPNAKHKAGSKIIRF